MKAVIRSDASTQIGTGHVMRCLALADELKLQDVEVCFICREYAGNMADVLNKNGYIVHLLPVMHCTDDQLSNESLAYAKQIGLSWEEDLEKTVEILEKGCQCDLLVVDHYALDARWESGVRAVVKKIMVIDDLANRHHNCDLLIDQNLYESMGTRYEGLLPDYTQVLLGPKYTILRKEFFDARSKAENTRVEKSVSQVLVFFGGSDPTRETEKAIEAIQRLQPAGIMFDVVVGNSNPEKRKIELTCRSLQNVNYYCQIDNISELMLQADFAIGAAGSASWERCFLGLGSVVIVTADNQREVASMLVKEDAVISLGESSQVSVDDIVDVINRLSREPGKVQSLSVNSFRIMPENQLKNKLKDFLEVVFQ